MTTESTKTPTKEEALGTVATSVVSGLSPKDKALAAGLLVLIGGVTGWFNKDTQADVAAMKTQTAVMVEKLNDIQADLKDVYTKTEAQSAWERQKEIDAQQTKTLDKISALVDEHLRASHN